MRRTWFMILLPSGAKLLLCTYTGWAGLMRIVPYLDKERAKNATILPLNAWKVLAYALLGRIPGIHADVAQR